MKQQLEQVVRRLTVVEALPSSTLDECARWSDLVNRYETLRAGAGHSPYLMPYLAERPNAQRKRAECEELKRADKEIESQLSSYKQLAERESGQLDFVSRLINEHLDLMRHDSEVYRNRFDAFRASDERVGAIAAVVDRFVASLSSRLAGPVEPLDRLTALDDTVRSLIDRESDLGHEGFEHLAILRNELEKELAKVPTKTARYRYLLGTLDAANSAILHRALRDDDDNRPIVRHRDKQLAAAEEPTVQRVVEAPPAERAVQESTKQPAPASAQQPAAPSAAVAHASPTHAYAMSSAAGESNQPQQTARAAAQVGSGGQAMAAASTGNGQQQPAWFSDGPLPALSAAGNGQAQEQQPAKNRVRLPRRR